MKKLISLLMVITFLSSSVSDGNSYYKVRTITGVSITYVGDKSVLMVAISGALDAIPNCAKEQGLERLAIDSSNPHYKEIVALVMAAYVSKDKSIDFYVTDTCNFFPHTQDIFAVKMGTMPF